MRRLRLNEDMVRRIEEALDERKQQRRTPTKPADYPEDRRGPSSGRRNDDRPARTPRKQSRTSRSRRA